MADSEKEDIDLTEIANMSIKDIEAKLRESGIDVDAALERLQETIDKYTPKPPQ